VTLDLNGDSWQKVYQINLQAETSAIPNHFYQIPSFTIPYTFINKIAVGASSSSAKPNWRLAFYANALVNILGIGFVEVEHFYVPFGASLLDPQKGVPYTLKLYIPKWHQNMDVEIWEYTGSQS
jgi:hypothetical protein